MGSLLRITAITFTCAFLGAAAGSAHATTWNVPGDMSNTCTMGNPSCDTIQGAITASIAGDDIQVAAGTYLESNLIVDKALTINGAGPGSTIVDPSGAVGFRPQANGIVISNLSVENGSDGMRFELVAGTIDDTEINNVHLISNASDGIELSGSTTVTNLQIIGSTFTGNSNGMRMASTSTVNGVTVTGSTFDGNLSIGIYQANDGFSSTLSNLSVSGSTFQSNAFAGIYAEELQGGLIETNTFTSNGRGILLFKGFATSGADMGDVAIQDNDFTDSTAASIQVVIQASGLSAAIDVTANTIAQDVGALTTNFASIDIRLANSFTHAPVTVVDNSVTLSGTFGVATAAYGIGIRGNGPVVMTGNALDGGSVGGTSTTPPTSGIYLRSVDASPSFGTIPATASFTAQCNRITGFENGVSVYDSVGLAYGGLQPGTTVTLENNAIEGNNQAGVVNGASPPTIDAENNWWGCPAGPGNAGCDDVVGNVDADPASATPALCAPCLQDADCTDGNGCTQDTCESGFCASAGEPIDPGTCFATTSAQLQVRSNVSPSKNQIKWKWSKGEAFDQSMLGNPDVDTEYALCIYDTTAGAASLETSLVVAPSLLWQSKAPKGWKYKDKTGLSDGVTGVQLKTGVAGKTKAQLKARGAAIPMPAPFSGTEHFDQDPSVIVQLVNSVGECWTSEFVPVGTKKNDATQFKAKMP